jgi:hypothetical protein
MGESAAGALAHGARHFEWPGPGLEAQRSVKRGVAAEDGEWDWGMWGLCTIQTTTVVWWFRHHSPNLQGAATFQAPYRQPGLFSPRAEHYIEL